MVTMEELLASQSKTFKTLYRGQQVEGEIVSISSNELVLDIGSKSEGIIPSRQIPQNQLTSLKVGDKLSTYVILAENDSGQTVLGLQPAQFKGSSRKGKGVNWAKFSQAQRQKSKLQAAVAEVNKGGLIVEVDGIRGFLPNSQVGYDTLSKAGDGLESLIGNSLTLTVIEVDPDNNKLIFTQRGQVSEKVKDKLKEFAPGQTAQGRVVAILPFGLVVDIAGVEGLVFVSDVSWEKVEDLSSVYKVGQSIDVKVLGIDESLGRLDLSIKQLSADPFLKLLEKYPADEAVKAEVVSVSEAGVVFKLEEGVEGVLPASKMEAGKDYETGKTMTVLIDSVDAQKRRINLAPFITSTAGLIYK